MSNETSRCPSCGVLNAPGQEYCLRCLAPLVSAKPSFTEPMTTETSKLYHGLTTHALLLFSHTTLEYNTQGLTLQTPWHNIASIIHDHDDDYLRLHQTPQIITMSLASSRSWFSDMTRTIPLRQFGYPLNQEFVVDLRRYAPQLQRFL